MRPIRLFFLISVAVILIGVAGCRASDGKINFGKTPLIDLFIPQRTDADRLWERGYGYNNPNASREGSGRLPDPIIRH